MPTVRQLEPGQERYVGNWLVVQSADCHDWYSVDRMPGSRHIHLSHDGTVRGVYSWEEPTPEELAREAAARKWRAEEKARLDRAWDRVHALWSDAMDKGHTGYAAELLRRPFVIDPETGEYEPYDPKIHIGYNKSGWVYDVHTWERLERVIWRQDNE